ncbi:tyrosine-protein phosphatase non-receptor type 22 isoform X3 [Salmo salar]|uniref:protein-tyrosine-phosphatase n=1 Tax=Salmo salar TaxID=8030 RepID=A0A1S3MGR4_SALSA|nr:tyrosine-protein phosphatase non-receptor type 12-like isoform X3 [Salmo salar]|eukprot:XP_014002275.1 PREDICTED: tyrosine-protein phosphatase non-receptor type 12-like isoform X3 [Salmo salar]
MCSPSSPAMEQQAWILRGFLAQVESKEAEEEEAESGFTGEFSRLKLQSTKYRTDKTYPTKVAEKQENVKKNRYKDIVPFDHSRVKLSLTTSKNDNDYINASFIKGVSGARAYIATQGPLPHTVLDFWRMLWEYNIEVIVMACREYEMGRKKCERYWPEKQEEPFVCDPFTIYCDSEESKGDYVSRNLRVTYRNWCRTLRQLHYINWPDHGVPDTIPPILELLQEMRSYQAHGDVPICIHCSAGCGRTGALCAIDYTWNLVKTQRLKEDFSIYDLVQDMRTQRPSVVQTKEQYELVYRTIKFLFEKYLQSMAPAQPSCTEVVPAAPSPPTASDSELSDLSEASETEQEPEPEPQHQIEPQTEHRHPDREEPDRISNHVLPVAFSASAAVHDGDPLSDAATCSPSVILNDLRARDRQREQQRPDSLPTQTINQKPQPLQTQTNSMPMNQRPPYLLPTKPDTLPTSQDLRQEPSLSIPIITSQALRTQEVCQRAMEQKKVESDGEITRLVPPVLSAVSISNPLCLTVEDLYFLPDSSMTSPLAAEAPRGADNEEELAPLSKLTENPCFNGSSMTLNDQSMELSALVITNAAPGALVAFSDEDSPPPLPERTPESYVLAAGTERPDNISKPERLEVILPPNAATEALRGNGNPPSPIPPLPERTPESFVLANTAGRSTTVFPSLSIPVEMVVQKSEEREWPGRSADTPALVDTISSTRSKSLKVKMTTLSVSPQDTVSPPVTVSLPVTVPQPVTLPPPVRYSIPAPCSSVNLPPPPPPPYPLAPSLSPPGSENLTPPLPERTPESFFLVTQEVDQNSAPCMQSQSNSQTTSTQQRIGTSSEWAGNSQPKRSLDGIMNRSNSQTTSTQQRIGTSSEWAGNSQPKRSLDGIMNRRKSVHAKSSLQEPLTTVPLVAQAVVAMTVGGSAEIRLQQPVYNITSTSTGTTEDKSDKNSGKALSGTKSLKKFKLRQKPETAPPPVPTHSGPSPPYGTSASSSVFTFGFGTRFGKPKGPRSYPETWV